MRIIIETKVSSTVEEVFKGFNESLFLKLAPPFPLVKLKQFDGCQKGDTVHIELSFILFKQQWKSLITNFSKQENEIYFIDKGVELPFFLKHWVHKHNMVKYNSSTIIIDDIEYKTFNVVTDILFYPLMYLQFAYRKPVYQKVFGKI
jgi:ligand-binding SRPBCC domain-containing protein